MRKKYLIFLLAIIIALFFSLHILLRQGFFSDRLKHYTVSQVQKLARITAAVDHVRFSLIPTAVILENIVIPFPEGDRNPVTIERIEVIISPWSLLTEVTIIKKIRVTGPKAVLHPGEAPLVPVSDGPTAAPPDSLPQPSKKPKFVLRELILKNGTLSVENPSGRPVIMLSGLEGVITPDLLMEKFEGILSAKDLRIKGNGFQKTLDTVSSQFTLRSGSLEIHRLVLSDSASRFALHGTVKDWVQPKLGLWLEASFPLDDVRSFFPKGTPDVPISGQARLTGKISGPWPKLVYHGSLSVSELAVHSIPIAIPIGELKSNFHYENRTLSLPDLSGSVFGGQIHGKIDFSLPKVSSPVKPPGYRASLELSDLDVAKVLSVWGIKSYPARQTINGRVKIAGPLTSGGRKQPDFTGLRGSGWLTLDQTKPPLGGMEISAEPTPDGNIGPIGLLAQFQTGSVRFQLKHGRLTIDETLQSPKALLTLRGNIRADPRANLRTDLNGEKQPVHLSPGLRPLFDAFLNGRIALKVGLKIDDMEEFSRPIIDWPIGGRLELSGQMTGTLKDPIFEGRGRSENLRIRGRTLDSVEADLSYQDGTIRFGKAVVIAPGARYELNGHVSMKSPEKGLRGPFFDITAEVRNGSPKEVVALFAREFPVEVRATGKLKAKGVPRKFELSANLRFGPGSIYGVALDHGKVALTLNRQQMVFKDATVTRKETLVSGQGRIRFRRDFEFSLESDRAHLEDLSPVVKWAPNLAGRVSGRMSGSGSFRNPQFKLWVEFPDLIYLGHSLGSGKLSAQVKDHQLTTHLRLDQGLKATGELEWKSGYPFRVRLDFDRMDIKTWLGGIIANLKTFDRLTTTGTVEADGKLDPPRKRWRNIDASVHLTELKMEFPDYTVTNDGDIRLQLENGNVIIHSMALQGPGTALMASGSLAPHQNYALFLKGEADLDLFRVFTKEISYGKGLASLSLQITDQWEDPKIRGRLAIEDAVLRSETMGEGITITSLGISFNERQAILETLNAELGGGQVRASGRIDLTRFTPTQFRLNLEITKARISPFRGLTSLFDASLFFEGDKTDRFLKGDVRILRASYERRLDWQTMVGILRAGGKEINRPPAWLEGININIHVLGEDNLWINNNLAKLPLEVDLFLKGTLTRPVLLGQLNTEGGTFIFRRNEFKLTSGTVDFISPDKIRPVLDIRAETRVRNYHIDLSLIGPMDKPDLILSSNPILSDRNEILCLLTFGQPCKDVSEASSEIGAAEGAALVSSGLQNIITDTVEEITGIDRIQVDPYYASANSTSGPRITVSKRLLEDRLYVTYTTTMDISEEQFIQMEYLINNNISLIGNRDERGRAGADLKLHFEFR